MLINKMRSKYRRRRRKTSENGMLLAVWKYKKKIQSHTNTLISKQGINLDEKKNKKLYNHWTKFTVENNKLNEKN